jgi:hypothetical protein
MKEELIRMRRDLDRALFQKEIVHALLIRVERLEAKIAAS